MYLSVQPAHHDPSVWGEAPWGWDVRLRDREGIPMLGSATFGTGGEATDLARLTSALIADPYPLRLDLDEPPPTTPERWWAAVAHQVRGDDSPSGWRVRATRPDGAPVAHSRPMSEVGARDAIRFLEDVANSSAGRRLPLRINDTCLCGPDDSCRHYSVAPFGDTGPDLPEPYLTVNPDYEDNAWWQVTAREDDDSPPLVRSPQVPSRSDASALAAFVASVANDRRGVLYHPPASPPPTIQPDVNPDDFVLVDMGQVLEGWRLQATTPDGPADWPDGPTFPSLATAGEALAFVERAVACFPLIGVRRQAPPRIELHDDCACSVERRVCRHYGNLPELPTPAEADRSVTLGVYARPYHRDCHGWEVVTTEPDGSPWQSTGPHPTVADAERARDFVAQVVNDHRELHILGWDPTARGFDDVDGYEPPPRDRTPTVGIFSPASSAPWYIQCRNPDGTVDTTSPPYPTYRAADEVLDQIGLLSMATSGGDIGHRASVEATADYCPCSRAGWRCEHFEDQRTVESVAPARGGLSL